MNDCIVCGERLPPLNGVEENDFAFMCESCRIDMGVNDCEECAASTTSNASD